MAERLKTSPSHEALLYSASSRLACCSEQLLDLSHAALLASDEGSRHADAVYFRDANEPYRLLFLRWLFGGDVQEWFWRTATGVLAELPQDFAVDKLFSLWRFQPAGWAVPVFQLQLGPGDRRPAPHIPNFPGSTIVITGIDGEFETDGRRPTDWRIPTPTRQERFALWKEHVPDPLAQKLAYEHRHSAARIAMLGRELSTLQKQELLLEDVQAVARQSPGGLRALAEIIRDEVSDDALVVPPELGRELEDFILRCRLRDGAGRWLRSGLAGTLSSGSARVAGRSQRNRQDTGGKLDCHEARKASVPSGSLRDFVEIHWGNRKEPQPGNEPR